MAIESRNGVLYMRFQCGGKRVYKSTGIPDCKGQTKQRVNANLKQAKLKEDACRVKIMQGVDRRERSGQTEEQELQEAAAFAKKKTEPTLEEFFDIWWKRRGDRAYPESNPRKFHSRRYYQEKQVSLLKPHGDFCLARMRLSAIKDSVIEEFVQARSEERSNGKKISGKTINGETRTLMMFLEAAVGLGFLDKAPGRDAIRRMHMAEHKHKRVVTPEEEAIYMSVADRQLGMFFSIAIDTSMEPGEPIASARWEDVHFGAQGKFEYGYIFDRCMKTVHRARKLGMTQRLHDALHAFWIEDGSPGIGWLFPAKRNGPSNHVPFSTFQSAHKRLWGKSYNESRSTGKHQRHLPTKRENPPLIDENGKARIKYFRPYDLRHTALTRFAEIPGISAFDLMEIAGWSSIRMADNYIHRGEDGKASAVSKLDASIKQRAVV